MTFATLIDSYDIAICPVRVFIHRGLPQHIPQSVKYNKLIMSVILELLQKCKAEPTLDIYSENLSASQVSSFSLFKNPSLYHIDQRDFLAEIAGKKDNTLTIWEGRQVLCDRRSTADDRSNYQDILSAKWHESFNHTLVPYHDLVLEEKSGRFNRLELQRNTHKEWEKKGYRPESGYGIVGLLKQVESHANVCWHKYRTHEEFVSLSFVRHFFSWVESEISKMALSSEWEASNFWLACDNDLVLNLLADYGLGQRENIYCPQICFGYHPIATFAASLKNLENQVFIHIHRLGEIDIAVIK